MTFFPTVIIPMMGAVCTLYARTTCVRSNTTMSLPTPQKVS